MKEDEIKTCSFIFLGGAFLFLGRVLLCILGWPEMCYAVQVGLQHTVLFPQLSGCWDCRHEAENTHLLRLSQHLNFVYFSLGWPRTYHIAHAGLQTLNLPALDFKVLKCYNSGFKIQSIVTYFFRHLAI